MKKITDRVEIYDWLRIMAIILVVIGHASYISHSTGLGGVNYELPSTINSHYDDVIFRFIRHIGSWAYGFHMPLFFWLSGAVYALKESNTLDELIKRKVITLIIPYILFGLLYMIPVKCWGGFYDIKQIQYITRDFLNGGVESGHLWFLLELFWCFVFAYLLIRFVMPKSKFAALLIAIVAANLDSELIPAFGGLSGAFNDVIWFIIGYIYEKEYRVMLEKKKITYKFMLFLLFFIVGKVMGLYIKSGTLIYVFIMCCMFVALVMLIYSFMGRSDKLRKFVEFFSKVSVYIYILHDPLNYIILKYAFKYDWLSKGEMVYVYYFLRTVGVFLFSAFVGWGIITLKKNVKVKNNSINSV